MSNVPRFRVYSENYISKIIDNDKKKELLKKDSNNLKISELLNSLVDGSLDI